MGIQAFLPHLVPANATYRPIPLEADVARVVHTVIYSILFLIGLFGNLGVIGILISLLIRQAAAASKQVQILILTLSIADSLVLAFLPFMILNLWNANWQFGIVVCKLFWVCEHLNKLLSTYLLLSLSLYCYMNVRKPLAALQWQSVNGAAWAVLVAIVLTLVIMLPIFQYSNVYALVITNHTNNSTAEGEKVVISYKCVFSPPEILEEIFNIYSLTLCFCMPTILQVFFYSAVVWHVYRRVHKVQRSSIPFWRVTRTSIILMAFYISCWTPYWSTNLYHYYNPPTQMSPESPYYVVSLIIHTLPYINAAINPTLYTYMNKSIRESIPIVNRRTMGAPGAGPNRNNPNAQKPETTEQTKWGAVAEDEGTQMPLLSTNANSTA